MRKLGLGVIVLLSTGVATEAKADVFRTHVSGTAAYAAIHDVSANGCVETNGELVALSSSDGTYAIAIVNRVDSCAGTDAWYAGAGGVTYSGNGLSSAAAAGTIVADEYSPNGFAPITIEFDLAFAGTGAVSASASQFTSGGGGATVSFTATRSRAANVSGSLTIDGDAATAAGTLYAETAGDLSVVH
jgi:hypothetical protein